MNDWSPASWKTKPAAQQPSYACESEVERVVGKEGHGLIGIGEGLLEQRVVVAVDLERQAREAGADVSVANQVVRFW